MASFRARIVNRLLFLTGTKNLFSNPDQTSDKLAKLRAKGPDLPSGGFRKKYAVVESEHDGFAVYTVAPKDPHQSNCKHVLYFHGGGYVLDIAWVHWNFIGRLIDATGVTVTVPIYPLAPEYKCATTIPSMISLFEKLAAAQGADNITAMGDSAGGGMALVLAHKLRDADKPMPEKLVLLSPWLDATANEPIQLELEKKDPLIAVSGLRSFGQQYAGELGIDDPGISPLFGTHQQLPPIQMFAGSADVLLPDARRFQDRLTEAGGVVEYHEYEDMFHVWMLIAIPEGKRVMQQISAFMRS